MVDLSPEKIIEPKSEDQPCGPDLDMEDMDFMTYMAELDGHMPTRYFSFDPGSLDFQVNYDQIHGFLEKALDVRLLIPLAKLKILQGDIDGFVEALEALHAVLKAHWTDVHPAGDFMDLRTALLATLDDNPNVILPLQHATLFRSRRAGPITLRKWQLANGDVSPREDEETIDGGTLTSEIGAADGDEMKAIIGKMERGRDAINGIRTVCISEGDFDSAPTYERLPQAFDAIIEFISKGIGADLDAEAGDDDGADDATEPGEGQAVGTYKFQMPTGDVATREDAIDALFAAEKYYALNEPSSPNVLLLREARNAATKTFAELLSDLVPSGAGAAFFTFGKEPWFEVSLNDINGRNPAPDYESEDSSSESAWEDAGLDDGPTSNDEPEDDGWTSNTYGESDDAGAESDASGDDGWTSSSDGEAGGQDDTAGEDGQTASSDEAVEDEAPDEPEPEAASVDQSTGDEASDTAETEADENTANSKFVANIRPEALALVDKVRAYYRVAEPSSPVLLMLDRVVELASKNFIGVLREVLPEGHLRVRSEAAPPKPEGGW